MKTKCEEIKTYGIYVHIPFCKSKCNYCSFVSGPASCSEIEKYVEKLCEEIKAKSSIFQHKVCKSIYFGGGTPSLIDEKYIKTILQTIKDNYKIYNNAEISIECNPCTVDETKLKAYLDIGINRISFGVQSTNNEELKAINRRHDANEAIEKIKLAQMIGFNNISADIMIGLPFQTKNSLGKTLDDLLSLNISHISAYMLMIENKTPLYEMVRNNKLHLATEDECVNLYNYLYKKLKANHFERYEISNFSKKGYCCKHNLNYWELGEYIGFGVSAHSYYNNQRIANSDNLIKYLSGENVTIEKITEKEQIEEYIMLGLRLKKGIDLNYLKTLGIDLINEKAIEINKLHELGLINVNKNLIRIAEKHFGLCNAIILELI